MNKLNSRGGFIFYALLSIQIFTSCEKDILRVEGKITNIADRPVAAASVTFYTQGTDNVLYTTGCDSEGYYSIDVEEGYYDIRAIADGYLESEVGLKLKEDLTQNFVLKGQASLSGTVIDAQTGIGIDSVQIGFTRDTNVIDVVNTQLIITTNYLGYFELDSCPTGTFRIILETPSHLGRILKDVVFVNGSNNLGDIALISPPADDNYLIVLTWGADPTDLDAHFTGPDGTGGRFHICYWDTATNNNQIRIDRDDSWRYGPETVSISHLYEGSYRYSVHNYSDQTENGGQEIAESPARVEIYENNQLIQTFTPPSFEGSTGNTWRVFELDFSQGTVEIIPLNLYLLAEDDADISVFKQFTK
jgi:hypothetical protein